jgi:hypothetical protein
MIKLLRKSGRWDRDEIPTVGFVAQTCPLRWAARQSTELIDPASMKVNQAA